MVNRSVVLLLVAALGCSASDTTGAGGTKYTGQISGPRTITTTSVSTDGRATVTCTFTTAISGSMSIDVAADGTATEDMSLTETQVGSPVVHQSGPAGGTAVCQSLGTSSLSFSGDATSSAAGINATAQTPGGTVTTTMTFTGTLSGGVITGTVTLSSSGSITNTGSTTSTQASGSYSVTLK